MSGASALKSWEWFAAAFLVRALVGCAQRTAGQVGSPYSPSTPGDTATRPEHGGSGGGM
jgi:hypothetical protein